MMVPSYQCDLDVLVTVYQLLNTVDTLLHCLYFCIDLELDLL